MICLTTLVLYLCAWTLLCIWINKFIETFSRVSKVSVCFWECENLIHQLFEYCVFFLFTRALYWKVCMCLYIMIVYTDRYYHYPIVHQFGIKLFKAKWSFFKLTCHSIFPTIPDSFFIPLLLLLLLLFLVVVVVFFFFCLSFLYRKRWDRDRNRVNECKRAVER